MIRAQLPPAAYLNLGGLHPQGSPFKMSKCRNQTGHFRDGLKADRIDNNAGIRILLPDTSHNFFHMSAAATDKYMGRCLQLPQCIRCRSRNRNNVVQMKNDRQKMILEIIAQEVVETQEQLLALLQARGFTGTQATISRDIKQLHLIKAPAGQGKYRYAVSDHGAKINIANKQQTIFRESILRVDYAQNLVVLHTMVGLANGAAAALDGMDIDFLIGTLAGDDTVLLIMRDNESAAELATSIKMMLH